MSKQIINKRDGQCARCGGHVAAGTGIAVGVPTGERRRVRGHYVTVLAWRTEHSAPRWLGSPVSGRWAGGCPAVTADAQEVAS